jgi:DNA topoisomerase-1
MSWDEPTAEKCPTCGATLLKKGSSLHCSRETCDYTRTAAKKGRSAAKEQ